MRNTSFPFSKTSKLPAGAGERGWLVAAGCADAGPADPALRISPGLDAVCTLETVARDVAAPAALEPVPLGPAAVPPVVPAPAAPGVAVVPDRTASRPAVIFVPLNRCTINTANNKVHAKTAAPKAHPTTSNRRRGTTLSPSTDSCWSGTSAKIGALIGAAIGTPIGRSIGASTGATIAAAIAAATGAITGPSPGSCRNGSAARTASTGLSTGAAAGASS